MMTKKLSVAMLCIMLVLAVNIPVFGATKETRSVLQPQYTYINDISSTISVTNGLAKVNVKLTGTSSVTKIVVTTELQQKIGSGWSAIESWTQTTYGNSAILSQTGTVSKGYYYRTVSNFTVYSGSSNETATKISNQVSY